MIRGILQIKRKSNYAIRKDPAPSSPPFCATTLGKRQILPVPTAIPRALKSSPSLDEKRWLTELSGVFIFFPEGNYPNFIIRLISVGLNNPEFEWG
jgi:hypothetical protein